jgi:amino-acid N-acetyltransferase
MIGTALSVTIRNAGRDDLQRIHELLIAVNLPTEGIEKDVSNFLIAEANGMIAGTVGLEIYSATGLLRSAAVHPAYQNQGIGNKLMEAIFSHATRKGIKELILLTSTAEHYFCRRGFVPIDWKTVRGDILTSVEFTGACPTTATCRRKEL